MNLFSEIRKENRLQFPKILQIELTNKCPFNCPQCYKLSLSNCDLDFDFFKDTIAEAKQQGTNLVVLNGGEPLLYEKIEELLAFMETQEIHVNCFSSGYGLTDKLMKYFDNQYFHYCLSLNGSTEDINSISREGYSITLEAMKKLSERNISYGIHWVARHDNLYDFEKFIDLVRTYNARYISVGANKLNFNRIIDSPMTIEDIKYLSEIIKGASKNIKILIENCYPELSFFSGLGLNDLFSGCGAGRTMCHITVNRKFAPCTHLHFYEEFETIKEYWYGSEILNAIRHRNLSKCTTCIGCNFIHKCKMCLASHVDCYTDVNVGNPNCMINNNRSWEIHNDEKI